MKCPNCGDENPDGMKFCGTCGTKLPEPMNHCPTCNKDWPLTMKFCGECGFKFGGAASDKAAGAGGISMGDKNVVAGDLIGKKDETHISGNATIIKNEDQTKQVKTCHVCGSVVLITQGFNCPECGEFTCENCYDEVHGACKACVENKNSANVEKYKQSLKMVLADGIIEFAERKELIRLQQELGISPDLAKKLEDQLRNQSSNKELSTFEKINLEKAVNLFYEENLFKDAFKIVEEIYKNNPTNEDVLNLYFPVLAKIDGERAIKEIDALQVDLLPAFLAKIDVLLADRNLGEVEKVLNQAKRIWHDNVQVKCYDALFNIEMYEYSRQEVFLVTAKKITEDLGTVNTKLDLSWQIKTMSIVNELTGEDKLDLTKEFCEQNNLYFGFINSSNKGFKVGENERFKTISEAIERAKNGATIEITDGDYEESILIDKPVILRGTENVTITKPEGADFAVKITDTAAGTQLLDLSIINDDSNNSSENGWFSDAIIVESDSNISSVAVSGNGDGISVYKGKVVIKECNISEVRYGISTHNCEIDVSNCFIFGVSGNGFSTRESGKGTVRNCKVVSSAQAAVGSYNSSEIHFYDCDFSNSEACGIDEEGDSKNEYTDCEIYNNSRQGVVIKGNACPVFENCNIHSNSAAEGVAVPNAWVSGNADPFLRNCKIYNNEADNAGLYVEGEATGKYENCEIFKNGWQGIVVAENAEPVVGGCEIHDNGRQGIYVKGEAAPRFNNCIIHSNSKEEGSTSSNVYVCKNASPELSNCKLYGVAGNSSLYVEGEATGMYENCELFKNGWQGVVVAGNAEPTFEGCEFHDNDRQGISVTGEAVPHFNNCNIHSNSKGNGRTMSNVWVHDKANPTFRNCKISDVKDNSGMAVEENASGLYENCEFFNNGWQGVTCKGDSTPKFVGCNFHDNGFTQPRAGIYVYGSSRTTLVNCVYSNNTNGTCVKGENGVIL